MNHTRPSTHIEICPYYIKQDIIRLECARLGLPIGQAGMENSIWGYIPNYTPDSLGYYGEAVIVIWAATVGAVSIFIKNNGKWEHENSTSW